MTLDGFDGFVTIDKNLRHQQNIKRFPVKFFILDAPDSKIETLLPYAEKLVSFLSDALENQIFVISLD